MKSKSSILTLALAGFALVACEGVPVGEPTAEETLRSVDIPEDFDFATTKSLYVLVSTADAGRVEVIDARGRTRFQGPALTERPTVVSLSVPSADDHVRLRLTNGRGIERIAVAQIVEDVAEFRFD
ncbi:MAG: hypothetical protein RIT81_31680 [Deltaproteobacteria bacterium]